MKFRFQSFLIGYFWVERKITDISGTRKQKNGLQNIGYPFRNDFTSFSFNFRNGDGTGNKKLFPLSLLEGTKLKKN